MELTLGTQNNQDLALKVKTLKRHMVCLGASGSGKTVACKVICEEMIRSGIPVIAIDPQGDIASLALTIQPEDGPKYGLDPEAIREYQERAEVLIWTPGSSSGIPLSVNPLGLLKNQDPFQNYEEFLREVSITADTLASLLGYDLAKDDGRLISGILNLSLSWIAEQELDIGDFSDLSNFLLEAPDELKEKVGEVGSSKDLVSLAKKLKLLTVGRGKLLFEMGIPMSIETLLGLGSEATPGKTRLSVIYLNTLSTQEEKAFFISQIGTALYQWMLDHPSEDVQALFYIDEVAPFLPPVKKPACKDILKILFKQARKYGISCLIASQNPGDIDYTALAQCSTWNLGRMLTTQDIKKVEKIIKSMDSQAAASIVEGLPSLDPGQFMLFCPDEFDSIQNVKVRWLYTEHKTVEEDELQDLIPLKWKRRISKVFQAEPISKKLQALKNKDGEEEELEEKSSDMVVIVDEDELQTGQKILNLLMEEQACLTATQIAERLGMAASTARRHLEKLDKVEKAKVGRSNYYWYEEYAFLPEYRLVNPVEVVKLQVLEPEAVNNAEHRLGRKYFFVETEKIESVSLFHLPLWQVNFTETLESKFLFFFQSRSEKEENIYFHGTNGKICLYTKGEGFEFVHTPKENPSLLLDIDDVCLFETRFPGELEVPDLYWKKLLSLREIEKSISRKFKITVHKIQLTFLPVWKMDVVPIKKGGKKRKLYLDGAMGLPILGI
ncbi:MAG: DUF853 family protein [Planctomycetota bacterium]|nr:MAG: DUF853 family protein [Planctomycetota bacterium]